MCLHRDVLWSAQGVHPPLYRLDYLNKSHFVLSTPEIQSLPIALFLSSLLTKAVCTTVHTSPVRATETQPLF